ncbi:hypothetical protein SSTG_05643 [Streptomyces sp. e14]|nr:hypothetical protein SSTG_05643 [Streptomyces sp. e14]
MLRRGRSPPGHPGRRPRARGDAPATDLRGNANATSTPRPRGCSDGAADDGGDEDVDPAPAGMLRCTPG